MKKFFKKFFIMCVLHEPITVCTLWQAGHGKGRLLGKDDRCESLWATTMNYIMYCIYGLLFTDTELYCTAFP